MGSVFQAQTVVYDCSYCECQTNKVTFVNGAAGRLQRLQEKLDAVKFEKHASRSPIQPLAICPQCKREAEIKYDVLKVLDDILLDPHST